MTPEGQAKKAICDYLDMRRDLLFWVQESQGTWDPRVGRFRKKSSKHQRRGVADINVMMLVARLPIAVQLEVKRPEIKAIGQTRGRLSKHQVKMQHAVQAFGGFYFEVSSIDEAAAALARVRATVLEIMRTQQPSPGGSSPDAHGPGSGIHQA